MTELTREENMLRHPCFHAEARGSWGRVHLPVAPNCNIQCNFCNRLYHCANESRPGVTSEIYTPKEALEKLRQIRRCYGNIAVAGIAGPGDSLCEPEKTLQTLEGIHEQFPDMLLCLSTNGLNLPACVDDLVDVGVTHVTVTVNAVHTKIGERIYAYVRDGGRTYTGREGAALLAERQDEGIRRLKRRGIVVKINTVVVPGVNMDHVEEISRQAARWHADMMNCIAMIPVAHTPFAGLAAPTDEEMARVRAAAAGYVPQMYHCCRCRADAIGCLGKA
ncbi:radical SAM protein [uncultured Megasphaera sp.]|uniref:radical SAM protein n=1 Tax=uncultured Megasphaera sp. TaxID=165188 RepID=UPI00265907C7|nr:radical SAM protein [uncultured Megasphaera sp.]